VEAATDPAEPGWRPLIVDAERCAAIAAVITETVAAVAAWRREHEVIGTDDTDYATLRIYTASDDTVPDPDDEAGQARASPIATSRACTAAPPGSRSRSVTSARATTPTPRAR
jgi:hypothetical protein